MGLVEYDKVVFPLSNLMKKILVVVKKQGGTAPMSKIVSEIKKDGDVAQSTISRNIQILTISGLLKMNGINGKEKECIITSDGREAINSDAKVAIYA
jgi:predicted transcriptional regulator